MDNSESFQIPTMILVSVIIIVCMCYALIFVNPYVAINPFKPPLPTSTTVVALALPATWTPTATETATPTFTPTFTPTPSTTPTATFIPSNTLVPTPTRTRTLRPPTPRPPTPVPPSPYIYLTRVASCQHAGGTFIEGTVYHDPNGSSREGGVRVVLGAGSAGTGVVGTVTTRDDGYYVHVLRDNGSLPGTFFVWIVDGNGNAISDPSVGRVTTNNINNGDDPNSCWRAVVDFARK